MINLALYDLWVGKFKSFKVLNLFSLGGGKWQIDIAQEFNALFILISGIVIIVYFSPQTFAFGQLSIFHTFNKILTQLPPSFFWVLNKV